MSMPPTITTGVFFLAKQNAIRTEITGKGPDGFCLRVRCFDRQPGQYRDALEAYELSWCGDEAERWHQQNRDITPGTPLRVEILYPRSLPGVRGAPETHARVIHLERWQDQAAPTGQAS